MDENSSRVHRVGSGSVTRHEQGLQPRTMRPRFARLASAFVLTTMAALANAAVAITDGGQATYAYQIAVPPGIAGMEPKLSLSYSQGGVNGPLGVAWGIVGGSMITRCPANRAIDGTPRGVAFDPSDKLCLDGQRLIQTDAAGTVFAFPQSNDSLGPGSGTREYRTEKDSFARIRAYGSAAGSASNGPAYFKVWTKGGQSYEYGANSDNNANALISTGEGSAVVAVWAVRRVSDPAGNYMDFKYDVRDTVWGSMLEGTNPKGREWNLTEIQYTGNGAQPPTSKVVFEYGDRPDNPGGLQDRAETFHRGSKNISIKRLNAIRTYINSPNPTVLGPAVGAVQVAVVKLGYETGFYSKRSRLLTISQCSGANDSKCLPPVSFSYRLGTQEAFEPAPAFNLTTERLIDATAGAYGAVAGDFNGDGRTDILRWSDTSTENRLWLSQGYGSFALVANGGGAGQFNLSGMNLYTSDQCHYSIVADFNADGQTDILRIMRSTSVAGASCGVLRHILFISNGDGSFRFSDVTGIDFSQVASTRTSRFVCIEPGQGGGCLYGVTRVSQTEGRNFHFIDVDADGRLDIVTTLLPAFASTESPPSDATLCASLVCTRVFRGQANESFLEFTATNLRNRSVYADPPNLRSVTYFRRPFVADVNGDGLGDFMVKTGVWLSRGNGNFDPDPATGSTTANCSTPIDFNADGRSDCVFGYGSAAAQVLHASDGTYTARKVTNFNLTSLGQEMFSTTATGAQSTGIDVLDGLDGARSAILRWKDNPTDNTLYLSNGDGTFRESTSFNLNTAARALAHSDGRTSYLIGDFTGSRVPEILRMKDGAASGTDEATTNQLYVVQFGGAPADTLELVTSPMGVRTYIYYGALTKLGGSRYVTDRRTPNAAVYPKVDVTPPAYVVTSTNTSSAVSYLYLTTDYAYSGLKATVDGRGMLGFREIQQQSRAPNGEAITTQTQHLHDHPYTGVASTIRTLRGTLNQPSAPELGKVTNTYCEKVSNTCSVAGGAKVQRPYLLQSVQESKDLEGIPLPTVTTTNTFNNSGDPTEVVVRTEGAALGVSQTFTKTTTNQYRLADTTGDNWVIGRLEWSQVRNTVPNSLPQVATGAGTGSHASQRSGSGTLPPLNPAVLSAILQLLLDD